MKTRQTPTLLETALQHDRRVMLFVLVAIPPFSVNERIIAFADRRHDLNNCRGYLKAVASAAPEVLRYGLTGDESVPGNSVPPEARFAWD